MRSVHGKISFAKGYNHSFADFKEAFESSEDFKKVPSNKRTAVMKTVHKRVLKETKQFAKEEAEAIAKAEADANNSENGQTDNSAEQE